MRSVSPFREMGAYEALWSEFKASFKWVADKFREHPGAVPSDFVPEDVAVEFARKTVDTLAAAGVAHFGIRGHEGDLAVDVDVRVGEALGDRFVGRVRDLLRDSNQEAR